MFCVHTNYITCSNSPKLNPSCTFGMMKQCSKFFPKNIYEIIVMVVFQCIIINWRPSFNQNYKFFSVHFHLFTTNTECFLFKQEAVFALPTCINLYEAVWPVATQCTLMKQNGVIQNVLFDHLTVLLDLLTKCIIVTQV